MTQILKLRNLFAVSAFAAAASASLFMSSAPASADVLNCQAGSRQSLMACCEAEVREHGTRILRRTTAKSCGSLAVVCTGGGKSKGSTYTVAAVAPKKKKCWFASSNIEIPGGKGGHGGNSGGKNNGGDQGRGSPNNNSPAGKP